MDSTNPVLHTIESRISVRKFTGQPVSDELVRLLLKAAFCAPSACNRRPWEFVVVRDREILGSFARRFRFQRMMNDADLAIVVCGDNSRSIDRDLMFNDCSAAIQNILLAAHGLGLGACWCGLRPDGLVKKTSEWLHLPGHLLPIASIAIGWPDETRTQPQRYEGERVHLDTYANPFAGE